MLSSILEKIRDINVCPDDIAILAQIQEAVFEQSAKAQAMGFAEITNKKIQRRELTILQDLLKECQKNYSIWLLNTKRHNKEL